MKTSSLRVLCAGLLCSLLLGCDPKSAWLRKPQGDNEYPLPADKIPADVRDNLHRWVAGFIGLSAEESRERLKKRWEEVDQASLIRLRDVLLEYEVYSVVDVEAGGMVRLIRESPEDGQLYVAAPLKREFIEDQLTPWGLEENETLVQFLRCFGGLSESVIGAGNFTHVGPWTKFERELVPEGVAGFAQWEDALVMYHAANGNALLIRKDGKLGWYILQEQRVTLAAESFDDFVHKLAHYWKNTSFPIDAYSFPEP